MTTEPPVEFDWIAVPGKTVRFENGTSAVVAPFRVARWPVSLDQFRAFAGATGYRTLAEREGSRRTYLDNQVLRKLARLSAKRRRQRELGRAAERDAPYVPAICVAHGDAVAFCEWAGVQLPTEAQWLAAAVLNWEDRFAIPDETIDAINRYGLREDAIKAVGGEWTRETSSREDLLASGRRNELLNSLFTERQRASTVWGVLRTAPQYVLHAQWQTSPGSLLVPAAFWHEMVSFRVCCPCDGRSPDAVI